MDENTTLNRSAGTYTKPTYEVISPDTQILLAYADALAANDEKAIESLSKKVLLEPESLKAMKECFGANYIREKGYRTELADKRYGDDWLNR